MAKNAQISLFLIVGLILVVAAVGGGLYYFSSNRAAADSREFLTTQADFESSTNSLRSMVQSCLEKNTEEAMKRYSIREDSAPKIGEYLEITLPSCVDFAYFEERGFSLTRDEPWANVIITEDAIVVELTYNIRMKRGSETINLKEFSYNIPRLKSGQLSLDPVTGETIEPVFVIPEDESAELEVPEGIIATASDGSPITEVSIKLLDKNFEGLSNSVLAGKIVYEGLPDGARFSSPVTLRIKYDDNDIPPGMTVDDLSIAYFDRSRGIWMSLPTTIDKENSQLIAQTTHFTVFGSVAKCNADTLTPTTIQGQIFTHLITKGECGDGDWEYDSGLHEKQDNTKVPEYRNTGSAAFGQITEGDPALEDWDQDDMYENKVSIEGYCTNPDTGIEIPFNTGDFTEEGYCNNLWSVKINGFFDGGLNSEFIGADNIKDTIEKKCIKSRISDQECEITLPGDAGSQIATPKTWGYEGTPGYLAGFGSLYFNLADRGDTCVAGVEEGGSVWMEVSYTSTSPEGSGILCTGDCNSYSNPGGVIESFAFNPKLENLGNDRGLRGNSNYVVFRVKDTNPDDGCLTVDATLILKGRGITQQEIPDTNLVQTTVGERLAYLSGCGSGGDPDDTEYDDLDYLVDNFPELDLIDKPLSDPEVLYRLPGYVSPVGGNCAEDGVKICRLGELTIADKNCKCGGITYGGIYDATCDGSVLAEKDCVGVLYPGQDEGCKCGDNTPFTAEPNKPYATYSCEKGEIIRNCPEGILLWGDGGCYCKDVLYDNLVGIKACSISEGIHPLCQEGKLVASDDTSYPPCLCHGKTYWNGETDNICLSDGNLAEIDCIPHIVLGYEHNNCKCGGNYFVYNEVIGKKCENGELLDVPCPEGDYLTPAHVGCNCGEGNYYDGTESGQKCSDGALSTASCPTMRLLLEKDTGCECQYDGGPSRYYYSSSLEVYCNPTNGLVNQGGVKYVPCDNNMQEGCICKGVQYDPSLYHGDATCGENGLTGTKLCPKATLTSIYKGCYCEAGANSGTLQLNEGEIAQCSDQGIIFGQPCRELYVLFETGCYCRGVELKQGIFDSATDYYNANNIPAEDRGVYCNPDKGFVDKTGNNVFT